MYAIMNADPSPAATSWAAVGAQQRLQSAIDALNDAARDLRRIAADADWQSRGVAKLHVVLAEMVEKCVSETAELFERLRELDWVGAL